MVSSALGFGSAALIVETVKLFCELGCASGVFRQEEFDDFAGDVHSTSGVDARGEAKAYLGGGGGAVDGNLRHLHEGAKAGLDRISELAQARVRR